MLPDRLSGELHHELSEVVDLLVLDLLHRLPVLPFPREILEAEEELGTKDPAFTEKTGTDAVSCYHLPVLIEDIKTSSEHRKGKDEARIGNEEIVVFVKVVDIVVHLDYPLLCFSHVADLKGSF